jgi:hypothetical protein
MPDYKKMYLMMVRETENAVQTLIQVQKACEELYIQDEGPVLRVLPKGSGEEVPEGPENALT